MLDLKQYTDPKPTEKWDPYIQIQEKSLRIHNIGCSTGTIIELLLKRP